MSTQLAGFHLDENETQQLVLRARVEDFLYHEAALLDAWQLDEWLALFTEDAHYVVPPTDQPERDPHDTLSLIDDDYLRLSWRVKRLNSRRAHREFPWSRTRRFVTNVRITRTSRDDIDAEAAVLLYRFRRSYADPFIGHYRHTLVPDGSSFKIRYRRAELDQESLTPNGSVSMIL